ncbi:undecaprenyl-diphosphate phosphatase [Fundidesulfovibrio terrae]|uniref:undecaprenyl-diphosphate phosphatase n=1 Tax=Fundidesulfovibrio terrae TaxID=2922866 RepID=UPI001FAF91B1|nr:undecaprenyl-diphosphate phosphatase [Fundidesulfovibrio terrae]
MTWFQNILFALVQGVSELFPVSSVAHGVLTPWFFGWDLSPVFLKEHFLPYVVMLHLGTCLALLLYFLEDWKRIASSLWNKDGKRELLLVVAGTVPPAVLGFAFEKSLRRIFASVTSAAVFLIVNGVLLFVGERLKARGSKRLEDLSMPQALTVGFFQSLALIPGFSRSGASMVGGFLFGLTHEEAVRYSMLLATPIIMGATILEAPKLLAADVGDLLSQSLAGGAVAGAAAFASVWLMIRWFRRHEVNAMWPFSLYCLALGSVVLLSRAL